MDLRFQVRVTFFFQCDVMRPQEMSFRRRTNQQGKEVNVIYIVVQTSLSLRKVIIISIIITIIIITTINLNHIFYNFIPLSKLPNTPHLYGPFHVCCSRQASLTILCSSVVVRLATKRHHPPLYRFTFTAAEGGQCRRDVPGACRWMREMPEMGFLK